MDWDARPRQSADLEKNDVTDGWIVRRRGVAEIHYLNATAALVLEMCDGSIAARELPGLVAVLFDLSDPPTADVEACLTQLTEAGLLDWKAPRKRAVRRGAA